MKIKFQYSILILLIIQSSCFITNTPGFYSGYKKLNEIDKSKIVFIKDTIPEDKDLPIIYAVNGKQLLRLLKHKSKALVYQWAPNCTSENCVSLAYANELCLKNKYELIVLLEYYDMEQFDVQNIYNYQVVIPNHIYYKSDFANKYNTLFINDIKKGFNSSKEQSYYRFHVFSNDSLIDIKRSIEEVFYSKL